MSHEIEKMILGIYVIRKILLEFWSLEGLEIEE
jgi:hypothetical protein